MCLGVLLGKCEGEWGGGKCEEVAESVCEIVESV